MPEIKIAEEFANIVATINGYPVASVFAGLFIILLMCLRKDGIVTKWISYLEKRADHEAALDAKRMELVALYEARNQLLLPGFKRDNGS